MAGVPQRASVAQADARRSGDEARRLSRGVVNLYKKYTGRGPSYARTYIHDDLIVTVLSDALTQAELTLKSEDREAMIREQRRVFQDAFREEAVELVEEVLGRRVATFLSDQSIEPDRAVEVWLLEPAREA